MAAKEDIIQRFTHPEAETPGERVFRTIWDGWDARANEQSQEARIILFLARLTDLLAERGLIDEPELTEILYEVVSS